MGAEGKVIVVTGANSGIGRETARALAKQGATVVMACRNLAKAVPVCKALQSESGNERVEVMRLDLASMASVREFARRFADRYGGLDVLVNNAGAVFLRRQETEDGFERTMATNYLGPFLLTGLLLPLLGQAPEPRIVNVGSDAHFAGNLDIADLQLKRRFSVFGAYATSRLATVFFTQELAERLNGAGITANALHPGGVATNLWHAGLENRWLQELTDGVLRRFAIPAEEGAQTSIYLAVSDEVRGVTGKYFYKNHPKAPSPKCQDRALQKALWKVSEQLTGPA